MNQNTPTINPSANGNKRSFLSHLFLLSISSVLIWRWFSFISRYAANILFWDQWTFYTPLFHFQNENLWQIFSWPHGPIREGIGLVVTAILAHFTNWDSRADAFAVGVLICLALLCAFLLKYRLFGSLGFTDVIIPLLFLNLFQYEELVVVPNLSYGGFPLLLIMLYCLALFIENLKIRYALILGLNFLLVYTGFGLFIGPLTIFLVAIHGYQMRDDTKTRPIFIVSFLLAVATCLSFLVSYQFDPAIPNFNFSVSYLPKYPLFIGLMLSAFWGLRSSILRGIPVITSGLLLLMLLITILVFHGQRLLRKGINSNRLSLIITLLISYSLLFCINTAIGRMPLGLGASQAPRYTTLLIPAFLALYLHIVTIPTAKGYKIIVAVYFVLSLIGSLPITGVDAVAQKYYVGKINWKTCYLQFEDIKKCDQTTGFQVFPRPEYLPAKLAYLKAQGLNLFKDRPK